MDRVQNVPQVVAGAALIATGGLLMGLLRPLIGDWAMLALSVSAAGATFLVVKTVRAARMEAVVRDGHLRVRSLWTSRSIEVQEVRSLRVVERHRMDLVELEVGSSGRPLIVPSWPPECVEELATALRAAGHEPEVHFASGEAPGLLPPAVSDESEGVAPSIRSVAGSGLQLGDGEWRRVVYQTEHWPERAAIWALGLVGLAWWFQSPSIWAVALTVGAGLGLAGLARRSRRISVRAEGDHLVVSNLWSDHRVELQQPVRLALVGGLGTLLIRLVTEGGNVVVEAAPWGDTAGLIALIEDAGGVADVSFDLRSDPPTGDFLVPSYFRRLVARH